VDGGQRRVTLLGGGGVGGGRLELPVLAPAWFGLGRSSQWMCVAAYAGTRFSRRCRRRHDSGGARPFCIVHTSDIFCIAASTTTGPAVGARTATETCSVASKQGSGPGAVAGAPAAAEIKQKTRKKITGRALLWARGRLSYGGRGRLQRSTRDATCLL